MKLKYLNLNLIIHIMFNELLNENKLVQQSYDKIANEFEKTRVFTWKWTDEFINNLKSDSFVLDIGCGTGRNLKYKNVNITGIDISIEQLKKCKSNNIHCDMTLIPFRDNTFDNIISIASFHHLSNIERRHKCLSEMKRIIKKDARILMSVWSINQPEKTRRKFIKYGDTIVNWKQVPRYYYIFEINELKNLLLEYFKINKHFWDCGNEIFILQN